MNTFKQAAVLILKKSNSPLHYKEITRIALEDGILVTEGATPELTMNSQILRDIKGKKDGSDFVKMGGGIFSINTGKKDLLETPESIAIEKAQQEEISRDSLFVGKAGEFLVCGELLFRNFNTSIMTVDSGIDIIATKDNRFFGVQVKTGHPYDKDSYFFNIRKAAFDRHSHSSVFYIFVLRNQGMSEYLIVPAHEIERRVCEGVIAKIDQKSYKVKIKVENKKYLLGSAKQDMTYFLNNWALVK